MVRTWFAPLLLVIGCGFEPLPGEDATDESGTTGGSSTSTTTLGATSMPSDTTVVPPSDTTAVTIGDPDGTSTADETTGWSFIMEPDGGGPICFFCCDTFAQDCPRGEKCMAWANDGGDDWNGTRCSEVVRTPGQPGEPCTVEGSPASGIDDCDHGAMCWDVDLDTLQGTCVALCTGDENTPSCAPEGTGCIIANDGVLNLCLPLCDPLLGDQCQPGQACVATDDVFVCMSTGAGIDADAGAACEYVYDCQPGLSCQFSAEVGPPCDPGQPGCCTPYCDLTAPDPTAACPEPGQVCAPWDRGLPPPHDDVGVCLLPA